jgi:hypothetical protein
VLPPFCNLFQPSLNSTIPGPDTFPRLTKTPLYLIFNSQCNFEFFLFLINILTSQIQKNFLCTLSNRHGMYMDIFMFNSRLKPNTSNICLILHPNRPIIDQLYYSETWYIFHRRRHSIVIEFTYAQ